MTPLAAYLAKQIVARPKHREHIWREPQNLLRLRSLMHDVHCFEVTQCLPLVGDLVEGFKRRSIEDGDALFGTFAFLPAPKVIIEWVHGSGKRVAVHLEEHPKQAFATLLTHEMATNLGWLSLTSGDFRDIGGKRYFPRFLAELGGDKTPEAMLSFAHTMLVVVNSPRIIGRRQHTPNAGLERKLRQGLGAGKFPLHPWTEIVLEVSKPVEIDDGEPHEAHLTGTRALHFCRKHIRIKRGRLEYVSAHWRGNPAVGIRQSSYTVVP